MAFFLSYTILVSHFPLLNVAEIHTDKDTDHID